MILTKLILSVLALICGLVSAVIGIKAYSASLRTDIRLKYHRFSGLADTENMIQQEYEKRLITVITVSMVIMLLIAVCTYLTVLCLKNNIPLI